MGSLFKPKTPKVSKPAPMPDPESPEVRERRRRAQMDAMSRAGRQSTILSQATGDSFTGTSLGG